MNREMNEMEALIAVNTTVRNVLLAELAYTKGAVDFSVVVKMRKLCSKTFDVIINATVPSSREKIVAITSELRKFLKEEVV